MNARPNLRHSSQLTQFAGVALADILANGVAMIIILIVITIAIKHEQEQEKISEISDVSLLLSRDISSSVVMNGLPSSGPAVLHDYKNSPLDRHPNPAIVPIIELHKNFIRDYYTGQKFSREELLHNNNAFDQFIKSMTDIQRRRIRIDIYNIPLFYITMSIIRNYGRLPSHWHFIGENKLSLGTNKNNNTSTKESQNDYSLHDKDGKQSGEKTNSENPVWKSFPQDTHLEISNNEPYPFDDLTYDNEDTNYSSEQSNGKMGKEEFSDKIFDALTKMMSGQLNSSAGHKLPNLLRFRTAKHSSEKSAQEKNKEVMKLLKQKDSSQSLPIVYSNLIISLFEFMQNAEQKVAKGDYTVLDKFDFYNDIAIPSISVKMPSDIEKRKLFLSIINHIFAIGTEPNKLYVDKKISHFDNALTIPINAPLRKPIFTHHKGDSQSYDFLPTEANIYFNLGLYPTVYKGIGISLNQSQIMLALPDKINPHQKRWRIVSVVTPTEGDFLLGFVYGHIDKDNRLVISSDENALKLNEFFTFTTPPPISFRKEKETLIILGFVTLFLTVIMLRRFRRLT